METNKDNDESKESTEGMEVSLSSVPTGEFGIFFTEATNIAV